jgi:feruloyl esterase
MSDPQDWLKFAVLNDTNFDFHNLTNAQLAVMDQVNPGGIATFDGDLSAFRNRGGKFLTYHGRMDPVCLYSNSLSCPETNLDQLIASGNSKRYYDRVARTLGNLADFYRLFLIPGMSHCSTGLGAWRFGQGGDSVPSAGKNDSSHNILLALVDWVERGVAPNVILGTTEDDTAERKHCRWPQKSVWNGSWNCVA